MPFGHRALVRFAHRSRFPSPPIRVTVAYRKGEIEVWIELRKAVAQWFFGRFMSLWPWSGSENDAALLLAASRVGERLWADAQTRGE